MGSRSMNYLVLKHGVSLTAAVLKYLRGSIVAADTRGTLIIWESNFTPMWARDGRGEACVFDLEEEVAVQRFLGSLSVDDFYMRRAGEQCDRRGAWADHSFGEVEAVEAIEADYTRLMAEAEAHDAKIEMFRLLRDGVNPHRYYADAARTGDSGIYEEVRIGVYRAGGECIGDVLVGLDAQGDPRVLLTANGEGEGDHVIAVYPLKPRDEAVDVKFDG